MDRGYPQRRSEMAAISDAQEGINATTTDQTTTAVVDCPAEDGQDDRVFSSQEIDDDHEGESSEVGILPEPAKNAAVRRLEEELAKRLPESVARVLSRAIVD